MANQPKQHSNRKHAFLSASGSNRWLNCTPSPMLEKGFPSGTSKAAEEGTLAHEFGDIQLQYSQKLITKKVLDKRLKELRAHELYTKEMEPFVLKYTSYVLDRLAVAQEQDPTAVLLIEERIDLSEYIEESFGTGDATIVGNVWMEVIDLKYGRGEVLADDNPQLKLYGLGILSAYDMLYDIENVGLTIVQPRLNAISTWNIKAAELIFWGNGEVQRKAALAQLGEGELNAGDWCEWCSAKVKCAAVGKLLAEVAREDFDFKEPKLIDDDTLLKYYAKRKLFTQWVDDVEKYVLAQALNGKSWKGLKLVEGKGRRSWGDETAVVEILLKQGLNLDQFTKTKLMGIGDITNLLTYDKVEKLLKKHIIKPAGAPTIALESDKRIGIGLESAKKDFGL